MMKNALSVSGLTKTYQDFMLDHILLTFVIVLGAAALCFFVSYQIAVKVYQRRDII